MSFVNVRFPTDISEGSSGGPKYNTSVISVKSGREKRNINWNYPRIEYDVSYGVDTMEKLQELIAFFHIVQGKGYTFRFKDHTDYKSCRLEKAPSFDDQVIGEGDGTTTEFQLKKTYNFSGASRISRKITKPVSGTVLAGVGGSETTAFSVDSTTGIITFDNAPADGTTVTVGYIFDLEARFDTDELSTQLESYQTGSIDVPVIEEKN